jgi:hypothetical protein
VPAPAPENGGSGKAGRDVVLDVHLAFGGLAVRDMRS